MQELWKGLIINDSFRKEFKQQADKETRKFLGSFLRGNDTCEDINPSSISTDC
jgi:hypothetical protein